MHTLKLDFTGLDNKDTCNQGYCPETFLGQEKKKIGRFICPYIESIITKVTEESFVQ